MYLLYQHALSQCDGCVSGEGSAGVQRSAIGFEQRFPEHLAEGRVRVNVARGSAQWNMVAYDLLCLGDQIAANILLCSILVRITHSKLNYITVCR